MLQHWILTAVASLEVKNMNAVGEIMYGLTHTAVSRLPEWKRVGNKYTKIFRKLVAITEPTKGSFKSMRQYSKRSKLEPSLPLYCIVSFNI